MLSAMGVDMGMFYKRRDYTRVVNGRNPIVAHEYLGDSVEGKTGSCRRHHRFRRLHPRSGA